MQEEVQEGIIQRIQHSEFTEGRVSLSGSAFLFWPTSSPGPVVGYATCCLSILTCFLQGKFSGELQAESFDPPSKRNVCVNPFCLYYVLYPYVHISAFLAINSFPQAQVTMKFYRIGMVCLFALLSASCSVYMAAHQPDLKDMTPIKPGVHQSIVHTELGPPVWSGEESDCFVEIYRFTQGYSQGAKTGRAVFHGVADVFTLGLWEVVGTPVETIASGDKMTVKVYYDDKFYATKVDVFTENKNTQEQPAPGWPTAPAQ
jgi:hypothetical protein